MGCCFPKQANGARADQDLSANSFASAMLIAFFSSWSEFYCFFIELSHKRLRLVPGLFLISSKN